MDAIFRVSVIIEGDNEKHCPGAEDGPVCLGLEGLLQQDFPLEQVDLILVAKAGQVARWADLAGERFGRVRTVAVGEVDYFEMKQRGTAEALSPLLAFVDSDVKPARGWLRTLVETLEAGYGISGGLTQLEWHGVLGADSALMIAFSTISWGAIWGPDGIRGFHANNVGMKAELFELAQYREGLLRACAAHELFEVWTRAGHRAAFRREQRVRHAFSLDWWADMHARSGRESYLMRRMFPDWPHQWVMQTGVLEPVLTALWRVALDPPQAWRYGQAVGLSPMRRALYAPLFFLVSVATRGVEMVGAYQGMRNGSLKREQAVALES